MLTLHRLSAAMPRLAALPALPVHCSLRARPQPPPSNARHAATETGLHEALLQSEHRTLDPAEAGVYDRGAVV